MKYVVKLDQSGYYSRDIQWQTVAKELATQFEKRKDAYVVMNKMRGYGWYKGAEVEELTNAEQAT